MLFGSSKARFFSDLLGCRNLDIIVMNGSYKPFNFASAGGQICHTEIYVAPPYLDEVFNFPSKMSGLYHSREVSFAIMKSTLP